MKRTVLTLERPVVTEVSVTLDRIYRIQGCKRVFGTTAEEYEVLINNDIPVMKNKLDFVFETDEAFDWFMNTVDEGTTFTLNAETTLDNGFDDYREINQIVMESGESINIPKEYDGEVFAALYNIYLGERN